MNHQTTDHDALREAIEHYERALKAAYPMGAASTVYDHWNAARKAVLAQQAVPEQGDTQHWPQQGDTTWPAAPEAAKPEQQAQAGEPEVVAYSITYNGQHVGNFFSDRFNAVTHTDALNRNHAGEREVVELITMQSYREAMVRLQKKLRAYEIAVDTFDATITKKDAALKAGVEALAVAQNGLRWYQDMYPSQVNGSDDEALEEINAAITQMQEALK